MDLLAYFRVLRRHWRLIVAVTVAGAALGAASTLLDRSSTTNRTYFRATNTLVFDDSTSSEGTSARHFANPAVIAILATTGDVPERVAETLGTDETSRELATRVSTVVNQDSDTLELTVIDPNAQRAALLADTFSDELIASLTTKELDEFTKSLDSASDRVTSAQQDRDRLLPQVLANPQDQFTQSQYAAAASIYGTRVAQFLTMQNAGAPTPAVSTLEPAQAVPIGNAEYEALLNAGETGRNHFQAAGDTNTFVTPSSGSSFDDPVSRGVLGGLLGLLAGVGLALVADKLDRRLRTREDAEIAFELPVLAEVPKLTSAQQRQHDLVAVSSPLSRGAEAYRAVRTSLLFQQGGGGGGTRTYAVGGKRHVHRLPRALRARAARTAGPDGHLGAHRARARRPRAPTSRRCSVRRDPRCSLLNCDFRRPSIHEMFGVPDEPRRVQDTAVPGVKVVTNVLGRGRREPGAGRGRTATGDQLGPESLRRRDPRHRTAAHGQRRDRSGRCRRPRAARRRAPVSAPPTPRSARWTC